MIMIKPRSLVAFHFFPPHRPCSSHFSKRIAYSCRKGAHWLISGTVASVGKSSETICPFVRYPNVFFCCFLPLVDPSATTKPYILSNCGTCVHEGSKWTQVLLPRFDRLDNLHLPVWPCRLVGSQCHGYTGQTGSRPDGRVV